jgi:hypothetical protein
MTRLKLTKAQLLSRLRLLIVQGSPQLWRSLPKNDSSRKNPRGAPSIVKAALMKNSSSLAFWTELNFTMRLLTTRTSTRTPKLSPSKRPSSSGSSHQGTASKKESFNNLNLMRRITRPTNKSRSIPLLPLPLNSSITPYLHCQRPVRTLLAL